MAKTTTRPYGLLVEDIKILATRQGVDFWVLWRGRFEDTGRITSIPGTATPQGDHVWIRCDDPYGEEELDLKAEAQELRQMLAKRGIPAKALRVIRRPAALNGEETSRG